MVSDHGDDVGGKYVDGDDDDNDDNGDANNAYIGSSDGVDRELI